MEAGEEAGPEHASPRPLSPTKLLPFLSNPHRSPCEVELEALRRRLHHAPRPLKKRSSITEPEGPAGPALQRLLYQKTTLAAMETVATEEESVTPPPLPPRPPIPDPAPCRSLPPPLEDREEEEEGRPPPDDFPPYPPPPYPSCGDDVVAPPPPEVTGQVAAPPVSLEVCE